MRETVGNIANVYFVELSKIHHNPINDHVYGLKEDISQLKENILINGLQEPLEVVKEEREGQEISYRILSGHGRFDSLKALFNENKTVMYQGKTLGSKVPCLLHTWFASQKDEEAYLIGANVRKTRDKESRIRAAKRIGEIYDSLSDSEKPKGETKRHYVAVRTGFSEKTAEKYYQDEKKIDVNVSKIQPISSVLNSIDRVKQTIKDIQMDEYGKTDKNTIKDKLDELILCVKEKKKEK